MVENGDRGSARGGGFTAAGQEFVVGGIENRIGVRSRRDAHVLVERDLNLCQRQRNDSIRGGIGECHVGLRDRLENIYLG
jgi:hypothetical protein